MKDRAIYLGASLAALLSGAVPAWAQQAPAPADTAAAEDAPASSRIEEIVVTARRTEENVQDVPLSVSTFSTARLRDLSLKDVFGLAYQTPSLNLNKAPGDPGGGQIALRGQYQVDNIISLDPAVGVYVNGVYLPKAIGINTALVDLERIEVLKGPQGTLFGKNTTGGAISITTRAPNMTDVEGYLDLRVGNYNLRELTGAISVPLIADQLALRIVGQHTEHDGYGHDFFGRDVDDDNNETARAHLAWRPNDALTVDLIGDYSTFDRGGLAVDVSYVNPTPTPPTSFRDIAQESGLLPNNSPANLAAARNILASYIGRGDFHDTSAGDDQFTFSKAYGVSLDVGYEISGDVRLRSITAERWFERAALSDCDGTPFTLCSPLSHDHDKQFSQELQLLGTIGRLEWIMGGYYAKEDGTEDIRSFTAKFINPAAPTIFDGDIHNKTTGVFAQTTYSLTDELRVTGGLRWTEERKGLVSRNRTALACSLAVEVREDPAICESITFRKKFSAISYLASVDWHFTPDMMVYAKTSRGFRGGGNNIRGNSLASFEGFKPEYVTDYEIGAKLEFFDRRLRINGSLYTSRLTDAQRSVILLIGNPPVTATVITNAARATIKGAELEVTAVPIDGLTLTGTMGYTDATYDKFIDVSGDRSGEKFPIPKFTYTLTGTYTVPVGSDNLRFVANYAWRDDNIFYPGPVPESVTQKSYGLANGRITYTMSSIDTDFSIWGNNLFDKDYSGTGVNYVATLGFSTFYRGDPRTFGLQITKRFGAR